MSILTVFLGIIVLLILFLGISYYLNMNSTGGLMDLKTTIPAITSESISKPGSPNYYYAVWVYVNTWDSSEKRLFRYSNQALVLDAIKQELRFNYRISTKYTNTIITTTFPIQKWVHVAVSKVGPILDFYLDGKLVKSFQPSGSIWTPWSGGSINFGGNKNDIFLSKFQRSSNALDPRSAHNIYLEGPGTGVPMGSDYNYNLSMSVIKDDIVQKSYKLY